MRVKVTVLCENSVFGKMGAVAEHGWAVFLETDKGNLLLDTGQGRGVISNARVLNIDLASIQGIILSHHHWDHTAGLLDVLDDIKKRVPVYAHPELFKDSYSIRDGERRHTGIPFKKTLLEARGADFDFCKEAREILPGMFLTGEVPLIISYETGDKNLVIADGSIDLIPDDQSLVIKTGEGLFIVLGCAHAGIINTIEYAIKITGEKRIHTVIGGTHLGSVGKEQRDKSIKALHAYNIMRLGVSHCTGLPTAALLAQEFGDRFFFCNVGTVVKNY